MTANECYRPPIDAQLRYTVQWFHEWSEMQRGDFLPILAQKLAPGGYVNGLLSGVETLSCNEGRPPSLFQCRVKLFKEWFETWSEAERDQLLGHIKSMDPGFHTKIQEELQLLSGKTTNGCNGTMMNGSDENGVEDSVEPEENHQEVVEDPVEPVAEAEEQDHATAEVTETVNGEEDGSGSS